MDKLFRLSLILFALHPIVVNQTLKGVIAAVVMLLQLGIWIKWRPLKTHHNCWFWLLMTAPVAGYIISLTYSADIQTGLKNLERTTFWAIFPWLLYLNRSHLQLRHWKTVEAVYVAAMAGLTLWITVKMTSSGFLFKALEVQDSYYWIRTKLEWVSGMHPTYYSMYAALALWMAVHQLKKRNYQWWYAGATTLLATGLLLASSKIILLATGLGLLVVVPRTLNWKSALRATFLAMLVGGMVLVAVKPIRERVWTMVIALQNQSVDQNNPDSMRKAIWSCSWNLIQSNPWLGIGLGDFQAALNDCYTQQGYTLARERQFNTHNQYFQMWLSAGFLPMLALLATVLTQIIIAWVTRQRIHLAFAIMMALAFLTENVLERQDGVFFFVFFTVLLVHRSWLSGTQKHVINGKWKHQPISGVQRYAAEISQHLLQGPFTMIEPPRLPGFLNGRRQRPAMQLFWEQLILPWRLRFMGTPALVNLGNTSPIYYSNKLVVIHDIAPLAHPEWFSTRFVKWYRFLFRTTAYHSFKVATISQFSAREISLHLSWPVDAIGLAPNGIPSLGPDSVPPQVPQPFILCVGTLSNRKNQHRLIEAFLQWNPNHVHLVLAGSTSSDITWDYQPLLDQAITTGHVHWVNHPSDAQLKGLYTHATAFACVSLYEGFGLPIAEALSHHLPCLIADIPVFREHFEGHALFVDPKHTPTIVAGLIKIMQETPLWTERASAFDALDKQLNFKHSAQQIAAWTNSATVLTSQATTA